MPRRIVGAVGSALLVAGASFLGASAAVAADGPCVGDDCDGGAWLYARGPVNEISYWGMSPGHNCTNYVAWRLSAAGIEKPPTHPGNAADWAANALADGFLVDEVPSPGAVAQWDASSGYGILGHVAYVERVNADGTILVSEDYWRDGQQVGPLTYRTVDAASVSHYIHYADESEWLRTASLESDGWTASGTHLDIEPTAMAALSLPEGITELFYAEDGRLWQASASATGWVAADSGVPSQATSLAAVGMDGIHPYLMSIDGGELVMTVRTDFGWQRMTTGVMIDGELAAVNLGGLWPTVYVARNGRLWHAWGDMEGWHVEATGIGVSGPIAATVDTLGRPVVFSIRSGTLARSWLDGSEWYTESTGVPANGTISVTQTLAGPEVFLTENDVVFRVHVDGRAWTKSVTGLDGGSLLTVVENDDAAPTVLQVG